MAASKKKSAGFSRGARKKDSAAPKPTKEICRALLNIGGLLRNAGDVGSLVNALAREAAALAQAEGGLAGLRGPDGLAARSHFRKARTIRFDYSWPPGHGLPGWLNQAKKPYVTNDARRDKRMAPELREKLGVKSALYTPILDSRQEVIGFIEVYNKKRGARFDRDDQKLMTAFSQIAAYAIQSAPAYKQLQHGTAPLADQEALERHSSNELAALHEVTLDLSQAGTLDELCRRAVELGRARLGFDRLSIWLTSSDRKFITGTFGIDKVGRVRDERGQRHDIERAEEWQRILDKHSPTIVETNFELKDGAGHVVGQGWHAAAALWDGTEVSGALAADTLLTQRPITAHQADLLTLYAHALGLLITRKRAEQALGEGEQRYRDLVENIRDIYHVSDQHGRLIYGSPNLFSESGYAPRELLGKSYTRLICRDDRRRVVQHYLQCARSGMTDTTCEFRARRKGGAVVWVEQSTRIMRDQRGEVLQYRSVVRDIRARKKNEAALKESQEYLSTLMNAVGDGIFTSIFPTRQIEFVNRAVTAIFGYAPEELIGQTAEKLYADAADFRAFGEKVHAALSAGEQNVRAEILARRKDGQRFWVDVNATFFSAADGSRRAISVVRDVSDRKQAEAALREAEEKYRSIFENAVEGIFQSTPEGRLITVNPAYARMHGYDSPEEVVSAITDLARQIYADPADRARFRALIDSQNEIASFETQNLRRDGSRFWVRLSARAIRDDDGRLLRYEGFVEDTTQRKQAEAALRDSEARKRAILNAALDAIITVDEQGTILEFNPAAERIFGCSAAEAVGRPMSDLLIPPGPGEKYSGGLKHYLHSGEAWVLGRRVEMRGRRADGAEVPLEISLTQIPLEGQRLFTAFVRDLTQRRRAEEDRARHTAQLQGLAKASISVHARLAINEILRIVAETAREIIGAHQCAISLTTGENAAQLIQHISLSDPYAHYRAYGEPPDGTGIYRLVVETNRPMRLTQAELESHPAYRGFGREAQRHPPLRGWLAAPLVGRDDRNLGILQLSDREEGDFTADDEAIVVQLAQMASVALENARLFEAERAQRALAEALRDTAEALSGTLDLNELLDRILASTGRLLPHDAREIMLIDSSGTLSIVRNHGYAAFGLELWARKFRRPLKDFQILTAGAQSGQPEAIPDTHADSRWVILPETNWIRSYIFAPIRIKGQTTGFITMSSTQPGFYTSADAAQLRALANQAAIAIENAKLYQSVVDSVRKRDVLFRASGEINGSLEPEQVYVAIHRAAMQLMPSEAFVIALLDEAADEIEMVYLMDVDGRAPPARMPAGGGLSGHVIATGQPMIIDDFGPHLGINAVQFGSAEHTRSIVAVPMRLGSKVIGMISAQSYGPESHTPEDQQNLITLANQAAVAICNARLYDETRRRAQELAGLNEIAKSFSAFSGLAQTYAALTEQLARLVGARLCAVTHYDPDADEVRAQAPGYGIDDERLAGYRYRAGPARAFWNFRQRGPFRANSLAHLPDDLAYLAHSFNVDSFVIAPIYFRDNFIGTIVAANKPGGFTDDDARLVSVVAHQAAVVIQNARLFEDVRTGRERLKALSQRLVEVHEIERRIIARELHDEIGQMLTGLKLTLEMSSRSPAAAAPAGPPEALALVNKLIDQVHDLSLDLRPSMLDDLGLLPALLSHFERYTAQTGVRVKFQHRGLERRFPPTTETAAYRITQEALTNVARHAAVKEATVRLWTDEAALNLQIEDRGRGFDVEAALAAHTSSGLPGMRERAELSGGRLAIQSSAGVGTNITAELPLDDWLERRVSHRPL